jgi:hypothetical protein
MPGNHETSEIYIPTCGCSKLSGKIEDTQSPETHGEVPMISALSSTFDDYFRRKESNKDQNEP